MKEGRCWLFLAAALSLLSPAGVAHAQGKKAPAKPAAPAPTAPAPAPAGGDIEIDDPNAPKAPDATPPAGGDTGGTPPAGTSGGICEIDPSACPKQSDIKALANKNVRADVYAVQQIYALRRGRFELMPYWSFSLNDQFVTHPGLGLGINYYLTNVLAIGVNGTFHQPFNGDSDFNFENRRATRIAVPLNEYQMAATANFTYVPMYGKFSGFNQFIFHYDGYIVGGVGTMRTKPIAVIDPDNRKFEYDFRLAFSLGFGLRIFFNRWFAITGEIRDYIYIEQLEATTVAPTQQGQRDPNTWFGEKPLTNNVQAQVGISIFLPFSWEYRLPK
ncbi:MAG: outer membrane beta-barrel domain-containing protein [Deltaproteobacteria bacterium]|nr:outer membrane beta-barrel domain-containing protein [Deltaproteobacteria bacterium]